MAKIGRRGDRSASGATAQPHVLRCVIRALRTKSDARRAIHEHQEDPRWAAETARGRTSLRRRGDPLAVFPVDQLGSICFGPVGERDQLALKGLHRRAGAFCLLDGSLSDPTGTGSTRPANASDEAGSGIGGLRLRVGDDATDPQAAGQQAGRSDRRGSSFGQDRPAATAAESGVADDRPAATAAARVSRASLVLGGLGLASAIFVLARLLESWRVTSRGGLASDLDLRPETQLPGGQRRRDRDRAPGRAGVGRHRPSPNRRGARASSLQTLSSIPLRRTGRRPCTAPC